MNVKTLNEFLPFRFVRLGGLLFLLVLLGGCTRFEDNVSLTRNTKQEWELTWHTLARRGINLVDSSGNVGGAAASFRCVPDPERPMTWLVESAATRWKGRGAAAKRLGDDAKTLWRGTVGMVKTETGQALILDLRDEKGRPFIGNRRYENAQGNGESWHAQ